MLRKKAGYILLVLFLCILTILYDEYHMVLIFLAFCAVPVVFLIFCLYYSRRVSIELLTAEPFVDKYKLVSITIRLRNESLFPISHIRVRVKYRNRYGGGEKEELLRTSIDAGESKDISIDAEVIYCGNIEIRVSDIYVYDYLDIWKSRVKKECTRIVAVLPSVIPIEEKLTAVPIIGRDEQEEYSKDKPGVDVSELFDVREYRPGDMMKHVHWKLSVKEDELIIKEFAQPINCSAVIMLDLQKNRGISGDLALFDVIMTSAVSVSMRLLKDNIIHYIAWYDCIRRECRRARIESQEAIYELIAYVFEACPNAPEDNIWNMYFATYPYENYSNVFYISMYFPDGKGIDRLDCRTVHEVSALLISEENDEEKTGYIAVSNIDMWYRRIYIQDPAEDIMMLARWMPAE